MDHAIGILLGVHTVVELASYLSKAEGLLSEQQRAEIVWMLADNPECGDVIAGTGGFRKVRVAIRTRQERRRSRDLFSA